MCPLLIILEQQKNHNLQISLQVGPPSMHTKFIIEDNKLKKLKQI